MTITISPTRTHYVSRFSVNLPTVQAPAQTIAAPSTQVRFGNATTAADQLKDWAKQDKVLTNLLVGAQKNAAKAGSNQVDLSHLVLVLANMADALPEELLTKTVGEVTNPVHKMAVSSMDSLIPSNSRSFRSLEQLRQSLAPLKKELNVVASNPVEAGGIDNLVFSSDLENLLGSFLKKNNSPRNFIPNFINSFRSMAHGEIALFPNQAGLHKSLNSVLTTLSAMPKAAVVVKPEPVEVEDPSDALIPPHERDLSNNGFRNRVAVLRQKGRMSDYQFNAIQRLLKPTGGGMEGMFGGGGGGMMDGGVTKKRLEKYLYDFAWQKTTTSNDPARTKAIMDAEHAYLEDVKKEMVNYTRRLNHQKSRGVDAKNAKLICLVGPPGVGKTSIALSLAKALGRKLGHISLSNIEKPSDLVGHSSTFVNAQPGRLFKALEDAGSVNPLLVLDEVDKLKGDTIHGSVADTLLPILDPKQNNKIVDEMLGPELPLDFSQTLFILTANYEERIPPALLDRVKVIRMDGYDMEQKLQIAKDHLIPRVRKELALAEDEFQVADNTLRTVVDKYTNEAGVRDLARYIEDLGDASIEKIHSGEPAAEIQPQDLKGLVGSPKVFHPDPNQQDLVGRVNGLAVSSAGSGSVLAILTKKTVLDQKDKDAPGIIRLAEGFPNGNLKQVIRESAETAFEFLRKQDLAEKGKVIEIAISAERGAIEKDGDSAGAAYTTAIYSALTGRPIRHDVAMTGTITIHGNVLAIGGVKQKLRGALRDGIKVIFIPKENYKLDWDNLPERQKAEVNLMPIEVFKAITAGGKTLQSDKPVVVPVDNVQDILDYAVLPVTTAAFGPKPAVVV